MKSLLLFALLLFASIVHAQPDSLLPVGIGGGGALFHPSFSPHNVEELYLSCDMGEVFHSTNVGKAWNALDFRQLQGGSIVGKVRFTNDPNLRFAISANGDNTEPRKSTDGGETWLPLPTDPTSGSAAFIYADYDNPDLVFISDYNKLYFSTNGGSSWATAYTAKNNDAGLHIAGVSRIKNSIYFGTNDNVLAYNVITTFLAVVNLTGIPSDEAIVSFTATPNNGANLLYCVTAAKSDVYEGMTGAEYGGYKGVYSTTLVSGVWKKITNGIAAGDKPFFISLSPENSQTVYLAGGSDNGVPIVYKTTDAGNNWSSVFRTTNNENIATGWSGDGGDRGWGYGEYALGFTVSPIDPNYAAITDLGFVHVTTDGGVSWHAAYIQENQLNVPGSKTPQRKSYTSAGIENTTAWHVTWIDSLTILASFSDIKGIRSTDGGYTWSHPFNDQSINSTYFVLKHPKNGVLYAATSSVHDMYQSTYLQDSRIDNGKGSILFSTDKGASWQTLHNFNHPVIWLAADSSHPNRLYASVIHSGEGGIYVTNDLQNGASATWQKLSTPPRTQGHPFNIHVLHSGSLVATYSGRRDASGAFTASSGVFLSTNAGATWIDRSDASMQYWTKDLIIDPNDPTQNTWYVGVFSGWGGAPNGKGGLYRTTNQGQTWTKINDNDRVTSGRFDPKNPNEFYFTTETNGLWYSNNITSATPTFTQVAAYPFRQPERVYFNPYKPGELWVTSFGNGLRKSPSTAVTTPSLATPELVSPINLDVTFSQDGTLIWKAVDNAQSYNVEIIDSKNNVQHFQVNAPTTSYNYSGLEWWKPYKWRVRALGVGDLKSDWSEQWSFTIEPSIDGVLLSTDSKSSILAYPNPAKKIVRFSLSSLNTSAALRIFDELGRTVAITALKPQQSKVDLNVGMLTPGFYIYEVRSQREVLRGNLQIVH